MAKYISAPIFSVIGAMVINVMDVSAQTQASAQLQKQMQDVYNNPAIRAAVR